MHLSFKTIFLILLNVIVVHPEEGFFHNIKASIVNFFNQFSSSDAFMANQTKLSWLSLSIQDFQELGDEKIEELLRSQSSNQVPQRTKDLMNIALAMNMTSDEAMTRMKSFSNDITLYEMKQLLKLLPPTQKWNITILNDLGNLVFEFPNYQLLQIKNLPALKALKNKVDGLVNSGSSDKRDRFLFLQSLLLDKIYGEPSGWTNETFKMIPLDQISPYTLAQVGLPQYAYRKQDLLNEANKQKDLFSKRIYLTKVFETEQLAYEEDPKRALSIANQLSSLKSSLVPEDFNELIIKDEAIKNILEENMLQHLERSELSPRGVVMLMNKIALYNNITTILNIADVMELGLALPSILKEAIKNEVITRDNIMDLFIGMNNAKALGLDAKVDILVALLKIDEQIELSLYPPELVRRVPLSMMQALDEFESEALLKDKTIDLNDRQISTLIHKTMARYPHDFTKKSKEMTPLFMLDKLSDDDLVDFISDLPPGTAVTMKAAWKVMKYVTKILPDTIESLKTILPYIGSSDVAKFNETQIMETLKSMKDINPSFSTCLGLQSKLSFFIQIVMGKSARDSIQGLSGSDIENVPVCIIAAFGEDAIAKLDPDQKIILLERLGQLKGDIELSILRPAAMAIVKEALKSLRTNEGIQPGELTLIGNAFEYIPASELMNADHNVIYPLIQKINDKIQREKRRPCFDSKQKVAVANMVMKLKMKSIDEWDTIEDVCCLLYTLSKDDLEKIKPEVLVTCSCETFHPSPSDNIKTEYCMFALEEDFDTAKEAEQVLVEAQNKASLNLIRDVEKQINSHKELSPCDRAAFGGANDFSTNELQSINKTELVSCLQDFGRKLANNDRTEILARNINLFLNGNLEALTPEKIEYMNIILPGFGPSDLNVFPSFQYGSFDDALATIGGLREFDNEQLEILGIKTALEWRRPIAMEADDMFIVNNLFCGIKHNDLTLTSTSFKAGINILAKLEKCPRSNLHTLALQAKKFYGNPSSWQNYQVAELGTLVAGLVPEDFIAIPLQSFEGLSTRVVPYLDPNYINAMNESHIRQLSPIAAFSFTDEQKKYFSSQMIDALNNIETAAKKDRASVISGELTFLLTLVICYARNRLYCQP